MIIVLIFILVYFILFLLCYQYRIMPNEYWEQRGYNFHENVHGDRINHLNGCRSIWVKNNKYRFGDKLVNQ